MVEYRTKPINRSLPFAELEAVCELLSREGIDKVSVSFGWDSNLSFDEMWKDQTVAVKDIYAFVANSESSGIAQIGKADIFVECPGLLLTLCHEGDIHVKGSSTLVQRLALRWETLDYVPHEMRSV